MQNNIFIVSCNLATFRLLHALYGIKLDGKFINAHGPNKGGHVNSIHMEHQDLTKKQLNKLKKIYNISIAVSGGTKKKIKGA